MSLSERLSAHLGLEKRLGAMRMVPKTMIYFAIVRIVASVESLELDHPTIKIALQELDMALRLVERKPKEIEP